MFLQTNIKKTNRFNINIVIANTAIFKIFFIEKHKTNSGITINMENNIILLALHIRLSYADENVQF